MRERSDFRNLRAAVILLGIVALSLHWSMREDPCARLPALEIEVINTLQRAADVALTVTDGGGTVVFQESYHLESGAQTSTGPFEVPPGTYRAAASVGGDGLGSQTSWLNRVAGTRK